MTPPTRAGWDELDEIFAKDFINFAAGFEPVKSLAAMKTLITELLLAFPDWHVTIEEMFAQDNKVVTRWSLAATTLRPITISPRPGLTDSCRRNSHRSYRRRQDRQTVETLEFCRGLQSAESARADIALSRTARGPISIHGATR